MSWGLITDNLVLDSFLLLALVLLILMLYAAHTLPQLMEAQRAAEMWRTGAEEATAGTLDHLEETPLVVEAVERSDQRGMP